MNDFKHPLSSDGDNLNQLNNISITHKFNEYKPKELNISIECIGDNSDYVSNKDLQLENEELQRINKEFKLENDELKERNHELEKEIDNLDLKTQELNDQIEYLTAELNEQKIQNSSLARNLQTTKIQLANDKKSNIDQIKDYNDIFENYKMYHRAYLDLSYFIDDIIRRLMDINEMCNFICKNKFKNELNLSNNQLDTELDNVTTINFDHKDVLIVYLENIEIKLDSLLLDDFNNLN